MPYVAQNTANRKSAVPDNVAESDGYAILQQKLKLIEQGFGRAKFIGSIRQVMVRGLEKVDQLFVLTMAAYNLMRIRTLEKSVCRRSNGRKTMKSEFQTAGNRHQKELTSKLRNQLNETPPTRRMRADLLTNISAAF